MKLKKYRNIKKYINCKKKKKNIRNTFCPMSHTYCLNTFLSRCTTFCQILFVLQSNSQYQHFFPLFHSNSYFTLKEGLLISVIIPESQVSQNYFRNPTSNPGDFHKRYLSFKQILHTSNCPIKISIVASIIYFSKIHQ